MSIGCFFGQIYNFWKQITTIQRTKYFFDCCFFGQIYNFWKQITTDLTFVIVAKWLFLRANLQFLKANHNQHLLRLKQEGVVSSGKFTIFESKSQQPNRSYIGSRCCFFGQIYNFWKQITTFSWWLHRTFSLFLRANLQFLKANHNYILNNYSI